MGLGEGSVLGCDRVTRRSVIGSRDVHGLTVADIQAAIGELAVGLEATTLSKNVNTLRQVLDFVEVEPNVARDRRVKLLRIVRDEPDPPDADAVLAMLSHGRTDDR
jgi:hypothetical protein